jgi:hypothetical protein
MVCIPVAYLKDGDTLSVLLFVKNSTALGLTGRC